MLIGIVVVYASLPVQKSNVSDHLATTVYAVIDGRYFLYFALPHRAHLWYKAQ